MWVGASRTCVNQSESDESNSWLHVYAALIARCTAPVEAEGVCDLPPNQKLVDVLGLATPGWAAASRAMRKGDTMPAVCERTTGV